MKTTKLTTLLVLATLGFSSSVFARDLHDVMKEMGTKMRVLLALTVLDDAAKTQAEEFKALALESKELVPAGLSAASKERYQDLLNQVAAKATALSAAIVAGDLPGAQAIVDEIDDLKILGHREFR